MLGRLVATVLLVACTLAGRPVAAEEPARPREPHARGGGALLFLSFLVPLPVTMALASPPRDAAAPPSRDATPPVARRDPGTPAVRRDGHK